jgi:hypothetical protein
MHTGSGGVAAVDSLEAADRLFGKNRSCHTRRGLYRRLNITDLKRKKIMYVQLYALLPNRGLTGIDF